jgi:hypothetical protein
MEPGLSSPQFGIWLGSKKKTRKLSSPPTNKLSGDRMAISARKDTRIHTSVKANPDLYALTPTDTAGFS